MGCSNPISALFKNENTRDYDRCDHEWTPIKVGIATPQCQGSVHGWNVKDKNRRAAIDFSTMPQAERRRSRPCKQQHRKTHLFEKGTIAADEINVEPRGEVDSPYNFNRS